jgi:benzylsuccinate CoA-transferase BbsF subunit
MAGPANFPRTGQRGRRAGANIGRTREIWPTLDGYVSFGLRGGKARIASLELIAKLAELPPRDWSEWNVNTATDDELKAVEEKVGAYFSQHTMQELYEIACETNLMLAPINSPREIYASAQLASRNFFGPVADVQHFPRAFVLLRSADGAVGVAGPAFDEAPAARTRPASEALPTGRGAWDGLRILEFGSGAAGPIATRYFTEQGATVLRVESRTRPDFLRTMALADPHHPHGLEGAPLYDALNVGKRNLTLNLKKPESVDLVKRLVVEWADAVAENYAPRAMKGFGLDYDSLSPLRSDLVMISTCLNGQTGPHKDYPGFGGQGSALAGYNALTGWPDREPCGPYGTITDSLAPRYVASALAAGLHYRRRTGHGVYLDVSQVESASWSLAPWLLDYEVDGIIGQRNGNDDSRARLHGAFACADENGLGDRWIAIACWTDDELARLHEIAGTDDIEAWTRMRTRAEIADQLQRAGIEAVPVQDFGDLHDDPQLAHRDHFVALQHPIIGDALYERTGTRLAACPGGYSRGGPTLGQDTEWALGDVLGLDAAAIAGLRDVGAVE